MTGLASPTPDGRGGPLHERIRGILLDRILTGAWKPGEQVPIETELAKSFGVSRMTMNKVLTQLSREGYLVRHKRRGTFVASPRSEAAVMAISSIREEVADHGCAHGWRLAAQDIRPLNGAEIGHFGAGLAAENTALLIVSGRHFADARPFCHEMRAINPEVCPEAVEQDFAAIEPGQWLLEQVPWTTAKHRMRAVNAGPVDARALGIPPGRACLEILRKTWLPAGWVTCVRLLYPGDAHQLVAEFGATQEFH